MRFRLKEHAVEALEKTPLFDRPVDVLRFLDSLLQKEQAQIEEVAWALKVDGSFVEVQAARNAVAELREVIEMTMLKASNTPLPRPIQARRVGSDRWGY